MKQTELNRPSKVLRRRNLTVSIWENRSPQEGESARYSASIKKRYRDQQGQWHDTEVWFAGDLLRLAELARDAAAVMEGERTTPAADVRSQE